MPTALEQPEL